MPEETAISQLSIDELQTVCESVESSIRRFIFSKVDSNLVSNLDIQLTADASPPISIDIEIDLQLSPLAKHVDASRLVEDAVDYGFHFIEEKTKEILACRSKT